MAVLPTSVGAVGNAWYNKIDALVGADTITFTGQEVFLSDENFTPARNMALPHEATGGSLAAIVASGAVVQTSIDPTTGALIFRLVPPVGGWRWETVGASGLPITIYGWVWWNPDDNSIWKAALLDTPVELSASGQSIEVDEVEVQLPVDGLQ